MEAEQKRNVKMTYNNNNKSRAKGLVVSADRDRISRVICNILENALKFTEKGTISVSPGLSKQRDAAIISVRDTGTGIDPEIMPRLFTKFATKSHKGTGLGLYICRCTVEEHGGRIWAENNNGGSTTPGATFYFSLPLKKKKARVAR